MKIHRSRYQFPFHIVNRSIVYIEGIFDKWPRYFQNLFPYFQLCWGDWKSVDNFKIHILVPGSEFNGRTLRIIKLQSVKLNGNFVIDDRFQQ